MSNSRQNCSFAYYARALERWKITKSDCQILYIGDSFLIWYWLNQHGKEAMLDMPLRSCQLQQHILADPVNSF